MMALFLVYLALIEWAAFGLGAFWRLRGVAADMPARWYETMAIGRYAHTVQQAAPTHTRLIAIGSSVLAAGLNAEEFESVWAREPSVPSVQVFKAALSGCTLYEALILTGVLDRPPPAVFLLGLTRRDVMPVMPESLLISSQAFDPPAFLVRDARDRTGARPVAQQLLRAAWPAYEHRILLQQFLMHVRPIGRSVSAADERRPLEEAGTIQMTGADIPLLEPWAQWCRERGVRPVLVMMPLRPPGSGAVQAGEADAYLVKCRAVAARSGIWFFDFSRAMPPAMFRDGEHLNADGAAIFTPALAHALAERMRSSEPGNP